MKKKRIGYFQTLSIMVQRNIVSQYLICSLQFAPEFIKQTDYCSTHFSRRRYVRLVLHLLKKVTESFYSNCNTIYEFIRVGVTNYRFMPIDILSGNLVLLKLYRIFILLWCFF